jgi:hypothetical protein
VKFLLPHRRWVYFSRPYGTEIHSLPNPGVETPGYYQAPLRGAAIEARLMLVPEGPLMVARHFSGG